MFVIWVGQSSALRYVPRSLVMFGFVCFVIAPVLSWPMAVGGAVAAVWWKRRRREIVLVTCGSLVVIASARPIMRLGMHERQAWLVRVSREADPLIRALSGVSAAGEAQGLAASFVSPSLGGRRFSYRSSGRAWEVSFIAPPLLFGTTDRFLYRSDQQYPEKEYLPDGREDGWYERVGQWAYFHDNDE